MSSTKRLMVPFIMSMATARSSTSRIRERVLTGERKSKRRIRPVSVASDLSGRDTRLASHQATGSDRSTTSRRTSSAWLRMRTASASNSSFGATIIRYTAVRSLMPTGITEPSQSRPADSKSSDCRRSSRPRAASSSTGLPSSSSRASTTCCSSRPDTTRSCSL